jgi:hypothetical protein
MKTNYIPVSAIREANAIRMERACSWEVAYEEHERREEIRYKAWEAEQSR